MRDYQRINRELAKLFPHTGAIRLRPSELPDSIIFLEHGRELVVSHSDRVQALQLLVGEAPRNATVGRAIDTLTGLRYKNYDWKYGAAVDPRHRSRVRLQTADDPVWDEFKREARRALRHLREPVLRDGVGLERAARVGIVLALHASALWKPELLFDPSLRQGRLGIASFDELMSLPDEPEVSSVIKMLHLEEDALPAPADVTSAEVELACRHGSADLLLDRTVIEVKAQMTTNLDAEAIYTLLGKALSLPARIDARSIGSVNRAGWYFARHGVLWDFPIEDILRLLGGRPMTYTEGQAAYRSAVDASGVRWR